MESTDIVAFDRVSKTYDGKSWVVDNLSLTIKTGEFLTLLGPSGSGKTTTLMMLAGFETPEAGRILVDGKDIVPLAPYKRDMGVMFQSYALFPHMTIAENIAFPLVARKIPAGEIQIRVAEALDLIQLSHVADRKPAQLSGGQQQRVALARALVYRPRLVLMDEPLGALDKSLRHSMQQEIKALHSRVGITFVYVTHDQDEALTMADRIAIFDRGKIAQLGAPLDLYNEPADSFVAGFLGHTNFIPAKVKAAAGNRVLLDFSTCPGQVWATAPKGCPAGIGTAVTAAIRPENIRLAKTASNGPDNAVIQAVVAGTIFHGDHISVRLLTGMQAIDVKANPADFPQPPAKGDILHVHIAAGAVRALEAI